ncbi:hypothetical protein HDG34_003154 [Paraburkholderia sp. HC6.4b]|uniref:DUF3304 domain-containing protein n=1 Tax=unclassified Paraburkholderia TaxID=2615204 RepID=UPI0016151D5B|nr:MULTISPECIES: DUF3304 domain-containing protein [unclassified Paraburkholderia]MBB5409213.1 hypothetical protein [Paraburkholderia sp. HC6.4b]MBB5450941.1 hypothetical protein [Paraburkholderia sp. Kb1A]
MTGLKKAVVALVLLMIISGCSAIGYRKAIPDVGVRAANYTENYITDFYLSIPESRNDRLAGTSIKEFSRGGTGGGVCCFSLARPGQSVQVEWYTGQRNDPESRWTRHSAVTRARGTTSDDPDSNISLIVRFFPDDKVEVEYVVQEEKPESLRNHRFDALFTDQRVMRQIGE